MLLIRILFTLHCRCSLGLLSSMKSSCSELKVVYFVSLANEFVSRGCFIIYKLTLKVEGLFQVTSSTNLTEITCGLIRRKKIFFRDSFGSNYSVLFFAVSHKMIRNATTKGGSVR